MIVTLALVEMGSIFAVMYATVYVGFRPVLIDVGAMVIQALAVSLCCIIAFYFNDLYDLRTVPSFIQFASRLPRSFGVAVLLLAGSYVVLPRTIVGEAAFTWSILIAVALVLPVRALSYAALRSRPFAERVVILGSSPLAHKLIQEIDAQPHCRYAVVGIIDDVATPGEPPPRCPRLGRLEHLGRIIADEHPDRIIVALKERRGRFPVSELLLHCRTHSVIVEDGVEVYERLTGKLAIEALTPSSLVFSRSFLKPRLHLFVSRAISLVTAAVGLAGLAPLLGLIALAIRWESSGPVFFIQERMGLDGRRFNLIKFRTMHPTDHKTSEWARDNGDRITHVGKWLRKFRLDELPQFVNVIRGDMNLVGPRPHPATNFDLFITSIPLYPLRAVVRPGITGWAQVRYGYANDLEEETEKMRYDLYYIKHLSLWFDLRILFATVKTVALGREPVSVAAPDVVRRQAPSESALRKAA